MRLEETRLAQEALAKEYGIYGFCYYHYWFNGKRMLNEPLDRKLQNPKEELPFMLCWANENWSRTWDGSDNQILMKQEYSEEDDRAHVRHLMKYFKDERYIKVDGKPFFAFYKPDLFPNMKRTIEIFREEAKKEYLELYLSWFERWIGWQDIDFDALGFDAAIEFQPLSKSFKEFNTIPKIEIQKTQKRILKTKFHRYGKKIFRKLFNIEVEAEREQFQNSIVEYKDFVEYDLTRIQPQYKCYPGVCPMWDHSARRVNQHATIFKGSTPELFGYWYKSKCENFKAYSNSENFIFINAWNEWAEGNHLEPCQKWGRGYLESLKRLV